jgi:hypothetical protein
MAEIITAKGTGFFIEKVIRGARERIVLISPFLKVQKLYLDELKASARRGVSISVLFREDEARKEQVEALLEVEGIKLFQLPELHAKCYFNEHRFVLTSMNLHDHSERNNKELGIMLEKGIDEPLFNDALSGALSILESSSPMITGRDHRPRTPPLPVTNTTPPGPLPFVALPERGVCIRCAEPMACDPDAPMCYADFTTWVRYENPEFGEKHCHTCGQSSFVSMADPMCNSCNRKYAEALKALSMKRKKKGGLTKRSWRRSVG